MTWIWDRRKHQNIELQRARQARITAEQHNREDEQQARKLRRVTARKIAALRSLTEDDGFGELFDREIKR